MKVLSSDLGDPDLYRLNQIINDLYSRVSSKTGTTTNTTVQQIINSTSGNRGGGGGGGASTVRVQYAPTTDFLGAMDRQLNEKIGESISVLDFGAVGDGTTDCSAAFNAAVTAASTSTIARTIYIPACKSFYKMGSTVTINSSVPISFVGEGVGSLVKLTGTLATYKGLFDVKSDNVTFYNFCIDGGTTTAAKGGYNEATHVGDFNNDPMHSFLTLNTSVWVHGPVKNTTFAKMTFQHAAGYSILIDATNGTPSGGTNSGVYDTGVYDIYNTKIIGCDFLNNRPTIFGNWNHTDCNYGSWNGGIFLNTYGIAGGGAYLSTTYGTLVQGCEFRGNYGNCVWSHLYNFDILHNDLRVIGNTFIDNGLDCILFGGVVGGAAIGNSMRRTGYIPPDRTIDIGPTNIPIPRWARIITQDSPRVYTNKNATALDTSGICKGVTYSDNSMMSTNGGDIDADGFCDGTISGNICITPRSSGQNGTADPEYAKDQISISGPSNDGSTWSYGVNANNTYGGIFGSRNINISGNSFINKDGGAILLGGSQNSTVSSNNVVHYLRSDGSGPGSGPITLYNITDGFGTKRTVKNNTVIGNTIAWISLNYQWCAITEDGADLGAPAFDSGDKNWIHGNQLLSPYLTEFYKDSGSSSTTGITLSLTQNDLTAKSDSLLTRYRSTSNSVNFDYLSFYGSTYSSTGLKAFLSDNAKLQYVGWCSTATTNVTWQSGDDFSSFSNGGSIVINGVTYTISTKTDSTHLVLSSSAGTQASVAFSNPLLYQGESMFNVCASTKGSITTGGRTLLSYDDVIATGSLQGDAMFALTDSTYSAQNANKYADTTGLFRYDSSAKAFKYSTSVTSGVRNWTTLSSSFTAGSDKQLIFNNSGTLTGDANLLWYYGSSPEILYLGNSAYLQTTGGVLSQSNNYAALNAWQPTANIGGGALLSGIGIGPTYYQGTVNTVGTAVTWASGATFTSALAGQTININGVNYTVSTYNSSTSLTLTGSAGTQTGVTYYSYVGGRGGYIDFQALSYANTPTGLTGLGSFGANDPLLWASGTNSSTAVSTYALCTNSYIWAKSGFYTDLANYQCIRASAGGVQAANFSVTNYITAASVARTPTRTTGDDWSSGPGVLFYDNATYAGQTFWTFAYGTGAGTISDANLWGAGARFSGAAYNTIQAPSGGLYTGLGVTVDQSLYLKSYSTTAGLNTPGGGYGGFAYKSGATYWYYNAGWQTVDFSAVSTNYWSRSGTTIAPATAGDSLNLSASGVYQIAGTTVIDASRNLTNVGSLSMSSTISGATTITCSSNFNTTAGGYNINGTQVIDSSRNIANVGTISTSGSISTSVSTASTAFQAGGGNFIVYGDGTLSTAKVISSTGASGGVNVTAQTATNSIQTVGGFNAGSSGGSNGVYQVNSTTVINASRRALFDTLSTAAAVSTTAGSIVAGSGYYVNNGTTYTGQSWTVSLTGGTQFTISGVNYNSLIFTGGIITGVA
jgi:hypothetical protein